MTFCTAPVSVMTVVELSGPQCNPQPVGGIAHDAELLGDLNGAVPPRASREFTEPVDGEHLAHLRP